MSEPLNEKPNAEESPVSASTGIVIDGHYLPPPEDKDGKMWVRTSALIQAPPEALYKMWRDVENAPLWQELIVQVTTTSETMSHWVMRSSDKTIEWDSEIVAEKPNHMIAWRSTDGESENAGKVSFEVLPGNRGTVVTVLQEFRMGKLASTWETLIVRNPKQAVIENLRHFKALAETGEIPRTQGQPHGPRGVIAGMKESMYGEKVPTPKGMHQTAG